MQTTDYDRVCNEFLKIAIYCCGEPISRSHREDLYFVCPFCESKKLGINIVKNVGHCFKCGWKGNAVSLLKDKYSITTHKAITKGLQILGERIEISLPNSKLVKLEVSEESIEVMNSIKHIVYNRIYTYLRSKNLDQEIKIRKTLMEPGLPPIVNDYIDIVVSNKYDAIPQFLMQEWDQDILKNIPGFAFDEDGILRFLLSQHILFPYFDPESHQIVAFNGKSIYPSKRKYIWTLGEPKHYYFPPSVNYDNAIIFTEGEKKSIAATALGIPTVGLSGVECYNTKESKHIFKNKEIFICYDNERQNDNVDKARLKLAEVFIKKGHRIYMVNLPLGYKLDDYLAKNSIEDFKRLMKEAILYAPTK